MKLQFLVVSPTLRLRASTPEISAKVLKERKRPKLMELSEINYRAFASRIESSWGDIYQNLPGFVASILDGRWGARPGTTAPADLIGDFGEFFAAEVFRAEHASRGRITRVLRPGIMKRPDFLVYDHRTESLTALEVKTRSTNASTWLEDLRDRSPDSRRSVNCCKLVRLSRDKGLAQVGRHVVHRRRGPLPRPGGPAARYESRVPAHRSAIVAPLFADGRMKHFPKERLTAPMACNGLRCSVCLTEGEQTLVLAPIFLNDRLAITPLNPPPARPFFDAYAMASKGLWLRSRSMFQEGLRRVRDLLAETEAFRIEPETYMQPLLDMLGAAMEQGILPMTDPRDELWKVAHMGVNPPGIIIQEAIELHELDRVEAEFEEEHTPAQIESAELEQSDEEDRRGRRSRKRPTRQRASQGVDFSTEGDAAESLFEAWARRWSRSGEHRASVVTRHLWDRVQPRTLSTQQWRNLLEENPEQEKNLTVGKPGSHVVVFRPSFRPGETIRLRFGGQDEVQVQSTLVDFVGLTEEGPERTTNFGTVRERILGSLRADEVRLANQATNVTYYARITVDPQPGTIFDLLIDSEGTGAASYMTRPRPVGR